MKLCTFIRPDGTIGHGVVDADTVHDRGDGDLAGIVAGAALGGERSAYPIDSVDVVAPLLSPPKLVCAATNYQDHIVEGGGERVDKSRVSPKLFLKPATCVIGTKQTFVVPDISTTPDWEAELAVVIGRTARQVSVEDALDHVFGYMVSNDISLRTLDVGYERDTDNPWVGFFDWLEGKWADGAAPLGPWLVTADEVADPQDLTVRLSVNGAVRQEASTAEMIFTCAELIAFCSRFMTLTPGDVILTGTPAGVGAATGDYLQDGDVMITEIDGLGRLVTPVSRP